MDRAEAALREALKIYGGGTTGRVMLVRVGDQTRVVAEGMADVRTRRAVRPEDRFRVASVTKPMVATAVLTYVASGRIKLDDPVEKWLPGELPSARITVRHLLSHRSGIHEVTVDDEPRLYSMTPRMIMAAAARRPLDYAPGTNGVYSNTGYLILGLLLERLSGRPLESVLRAAVFEPSGMVSTTLGGKPTVVASSHTTPLPNQTDPVAAAFPAAGGVVSTAADLDRFVHHLRAGDLVRRDLLKEMMAPTGTAPFGSDDYGLGLWLTDTPCGPAVGHGGSLEGFAIQLFWSRDEDRSTVVLINDGSEGSNADHLAIAGLCG